MSKSKNNIPQGETSTEPKAEISSTFVQSNRCTGQEEREKFSSVKQSSGETSLYTDFDTNLEVIDAGDFGVSEDVEDNSLYIIQADAAAKAQRKPLQFPPGVIKYGSQIKPTTSWLGQGRGITVIKNTDQSRLTDVNPPCVVENIDNIFLSDMTFDGGTTDDPLSWSASNFDTFGGGAGLFIKNCKNITISRCGFQNAGGYVGRGLSLLDCDNTLVFACTMKRSRGRFGDGFYQRGSTNSHVIGCYAEDFTRIGFTTEGASHYGTYIACVSKNGHDAAILYENSNNSSTATEYNAGFWSENSEGTTFDSLTVFDVTHYGITMNTTSTQSFIPYGVKRFSLKLNKCNVYNALSAAFRFGGRELMPIDVTVSQCKGVGGLHGALFISANDNDQAIVSDTYLEGSGVAPTSGAFCQIGGSLKIINCTTRVMDRGYIDIADNAVGDIITQDSRKGFLSINGLNNSDGFDIFIKSSQAASRSMVIDNANIYYFIRNATVLFLKQSGGTSAGTISSVSGLIKLQGCAVTDNNMTIDGNLSLSGSIEIKNVGRLIHNYGGSSRIPVTDIEIDMLRDIATNAHGLEIRYGISSGNPTAIVKGKIVNLGAVVTGNSTAIWLPNASQKIAANGLVTDANIEFTIRKAGSTTSNFSAGEQKIVLS